jgi:hypothetical protein
MNFVKYMGSAYIVAANCVGIVSVKSPFLHGVAAMGIFSSVILMFDYLTRK